MGTIRGGGVWGEGLLRSRIGIRRRVENSVGCLSEKRLFIKRGNKVDEEADNSRRPAFR